MRIAIDALILHGRYAGVEHYIHQLLVALRGLDSENEYVVYVPRDGRTEDFEGGNFSVRRAPFGGPQRVCRIAWEQLALPAALAAEGVQLVHGPAYVLPLRARCKRVVTVHDVIVLARPDLAAAANRWHYRRVMPRAVAGANHIVALSRETRDGLIHRLGVPSDKITVSYQGIREVFRRVTDGSVLEDVRRRHGLPDRFFLFVGQIEPKKNIMACVEAVQEYARGGAPEAKLVIAGKVGWGAREFLRAMARPEVQRCVQHLGYVPDEDLAVLYSLATALVFPSLYEGVGMPPLEAMACGCPAIVSDRGALPEIAGDAAVVVPIGADRPEGRSPAVSSALADAMGRIAGDAGFRDGLVAKGLEHAKRFSWARHARDVIGVYEKGAPSPFSAGNLLR
jgi:glycosyltransferase involved in cell wall biosynthesis